MHKLSTVSELRAALLPLRQAGRRISFVPTMGALHEGHRSLIRAARKNNDCVVVSIFVNPTQFGPAEDYAQYPRPIEADLAACEQERATFVFCPSVEEMYPAGAATMVHVSGLTEGLCGQYRPGHFDGVTTVVAKLFNIVQPGVAYFGQKDAQQAAVIRRMAKDLLWPIQIEVCPTVREADGVAMSSRNVYLSPVERLQARSLIAALEWARQEIEAGRRGASGLIEGMGERIRSAGPCTIDYIGIVEAENLEPLREATGKCLIALAVRISRTRLIDNLVVDAGDPRG